MGFRDIADDYVLTLGMIVIVLMTVISGSLYGIMPDQLPTDELIGGLLVLAGRLIKSD